MAVNTPRNSQKSATKRRVTLATGIAAAVIGAATLLTLPAGASQAEGHVYGTNAKGAIDGSYIVMLKDEGHQRRQGSGPDLAKEYGGKLQRNYSSAINGFSAQRPFARRGQASSPPTRRRQGRPEPHASSTRPRTNPPSWGLDRIDQADDRRLTRSTPTRTAPVRASRRTSSTPVSASRTRTSAAAPRTASTPSTTTTTPTTATATAPTSRAPSPAPTTAWPRRPRSSPSACSTTRAPAPPSRSSRASTG